MMKKENELFQKSWHDHVEKLIKTSAKKVYAVDAKHKQIVEGACKVFFEKGFHPTSMREIAKSVGMSLGQIYHYISTKDDVLFLIHRHMQISWYNRITVAKIVKCDDPVKKLELAVKESLLYLSENKKLIQFIYTESKYLNEKHLEVVLEMDSKNVSGYWCTLIDDAFAQQGIETNATLSGNLVSYIMVFQSLRGWNLKNYTNEEVIEFVADFIFKGLGLTRPSA
jgi:AcrR family transcriptional regulator